MLASGYTHCACRDCSETVVDSGDLFEMPMCNGCEKHDCHEQFYLGSNVRECRRPDAYDCEEYDLGGEA